ncbi:hypothetical protein TRAPUB_9803 [Trametes pubescens]|uniref:Endonuclease/exonuclease/phosphatase domain-containing protein n=1 Tax=Trametes pubescens TaxID=154538 RepID=A0A1M2W185_TRAPU|nr:hypothetical protein TRAPUB_9803 [Trametes pubescens]
MKRWAFTAAALAVQFALPVQAVSITDIQGPAFISPLNGQSVSNLTGIVTAKGTSGFWIQGPAVRSKSVSNGLNVFTSSKTILASVSVGDSISLSGVVSEFRSSGSPDNLFATELQSPANIVVLSSNQVVTPVLLGTDRSPPTRKLSALDPGNDGWLAVPNNQSRIDTVNATLVPDQFGMDFWASLEGQLVTVPSPVALDFANSFGEFWVHGDWPVTGKNSRGGLTISFALGSDGIPDANPEVIIVGSPLDGTKNPAVSLGKTFSDITGIIAYQFGFYYILPLTAPTVLTTPDPTIPPSTIKPRAQVCTLVIGDYNVENMAPTTAHLPTVANHIANFLNSPDLVFLQEIQDNNGATDDGTVSANVTLATLAASVARAANTTQTYGTLDIAPQNDKDGGEPGGNIRTAHLFNSTKLRLVPGAPAGGALDATKPVLGADGNVTLTFNPGRIDPTNSAWDASRKPLVTLWETTNGARLFTINLHLTAKLGGTTTQGNARPPVNGGVDQRISQVQTIATFVKALLALDPNANIIVGGDCNEYVQTRAVFAPFDGLLTELDVAVDVPLAERYTYLFDQNSQQLDHLFISDAIVARGDLAVEHVHVNNWAPTLAARASDHDPTVARVKIC